MALLPAVVKNQDWDIIPLKRRVRNCPKVPTRSFLRASRLPFT